MPGGAWRQSSQATGGAPSHSRGRGARRASKASFNLWAKRFASLSRGARTPARTLPTGLERLTPGKLGVFRAPSLGVSLLRGASSRPSLGRRPPRGTASPMRGDGGHRTRRGLGDLVPSSSAQADSAASASRKNLPGTTPRSQDATADRVRHEYTVRKGAHHRMTLTCLAGLLHLLHDIGAAFIPSAGDSVLASSNAASTVHASHTATRKVGGTTGGGEPLHTNPRTSSAFRESHERTRVCISRPSPRNQIVTSCPECSHGSVWTSRRLAKEIGSWLSCAPPFASPSTPSAEDRSLTMQMPAAYASADVVLMHRRGTPCLHAVACFIPLTCGQWRENRDTG